MTEESDMKAARTREDGRIGAEEPQQMLASEGYAEGCREQILKGVRTDLSRIDGFATPAEMRWALRGEVWAILSDEQKETSEAPISDDSL